ncbi:MAG: UDP-2,3-diacylglucosamine diphosphatase [Plesiomonas sp.]|uniref:UDP-2,3-diacylglucosamine diphosphatase n=1 Tax=Plesiomonas sp. TaxID=2486279 RepID=UPI003EE6D10C
MIPIAPTTLFIADLHLSEDHPEITACLLAFLQQQAPAADALYILGDLFEFWIGDDDNTALQQTVANALRRLHQQGVPCYFIHGNRDFLLGKRFARQCKMTLLPSEYVVDLYGTPTLIMHGDTLCTDDVAYQKYRQRVHQPWLQQLFRLLPLRWRRNIGARLRNKSAQHNQQKSQDIMDVNTDTVLAVMQQHQIQRLIHGHTHRPAVHPLQLQDSTTEQPLSGERIVLGDWYQQGSVLRVSAEGISIKSLPFGKPLSAR